jgi:hypothetical protein
VGVGVVEAKDGVLVHANHIDSPGLAVGETYADRDVQSVDGTGSVR